MSVPFRSVPFRSVPFRSVPFRRVLAAIAVILSSGCATDPAESSHQQQPDTPTIASVQSTPSRLDGRVASRGELEPFALGLAKYLAAPKARKFLAAQFHRSNIKEQKVELRALLGNMLNDPTAELASSSRPATETMLTSAGSFRPIEIYMPFPDQREAWTGDTPVQVVAILNDDDDPVAFQADGGRSILSKTAEPRTPTIVVTAAEQSFSPATIGRMVCDPEVTDCDGDWIIRGPGNATKGYMKLEMKP